jgi:hypothetical protein
MEWNKIAFIILTITQILSFTFAIQIFLRLTQRTSPLRRFQNQLLVVLLILAIWVIAIELPNTQKYIWSGTATVSSSWFCLFWNISFLSMTTLNRLLMAFISIERHFLVFRPQLYHTTRSRLLFHYTPLIFIISCSVTYTFVTSVFVSCPPDNFEYSSFMCGYTCTVDMKELGTFYIWILVFIPTIITIIAGILLPIRFIIQKRHLQRVQWHRARKMIIQTSVIASIYTICWFPYTIILQLLINGRISFSDPNVNQFLIFTPYAPSLFTPFIVFHTVPGWEFLKVREIIIRRFFPRLQRTVRPNATFVAPQVNHFTLEKVKSDRTVTTIKIKRN